MKTVYTIENRVIDEGSRFERTAECAIVDDVSHEIYTMKDGTKYFEIFNPYVNDDDDDLARYFYGRITDGIRSIRDGYAHALLGEVNPQNVFSQPVTPIYILDEEKGEEYRQKTIEGFKDAEFGYAIRFGNKHSFVGYWYIDEDGDTAGGFNVRVPAFYKTKEAAQSVMDNYIAEAKRIANKIVNKQTTISDEIGKTKYVVRTLFKENLERVNGEMIINDDKLFDKYGYEIVQSIR